MINIHTHSFHLIHHPDRLHESFHITIGEEGELFLVIGITEIQDHVSAKNTLYSIVEKAQHTLLLHPNKDLYDRFEEAIKSINSLLAAKDVTKIGNIHVAAGLLEDHFMYITKSGGAEIYLLRNGTCTNVAAHVDEPLEGEEEETPSSEFFSSIATGEMEETDVVVFTSAPLMSISSQEELLMFFEKGNTEVGCANFSTALQDDPEASLAFSAVSFPKQLEQEEVTTSTASQKFSQIYQEFKHGKLSWPMVKSSVEEFVGRQKNYLEQKEQRGKVITIGIIFLLIILILNISGGLKGQYSQEYKAEVIEKINTANESYLNGIRLSIKGDRDNARIALDNAKKIALELKAANMSPADAAELLEKIDKQEESLNKVTRIGENTVFIDLDGKTNGDTPKGLIFYDEKIYTYSSNSIFGPFVNNTTFANKTYPVDGGDLIEQAIYFEDIRGFVIKLEKDKIQEFVNNTISFVDNTSVTWNRGTRIAAFRGNLYLLGDSQIWKYVRNRTNYRGPAPWLQKPDPTLAQAVSFTADGGLYVLSKDGSIHKYFQGKPVADFKVEGAPSDAFEGITEQSKILTGLGWSKVYVLNHSKNTIFVFSKANNTNVLTFESQLNFSETKDEILDFTLTPDERSLLALGKRLKIYKIGM